MIRDHFKDVGLVTRENAGVKCVQARRIPLTKLSSETKMAFLENFEHSKMWENNMDAYARISKTLGTRNLSDMGNTWYFTYMQPNMKELGLIFDAHHHIRGPIHGGICTVKKLTEKKKTVKKTP